MAKEKVHNIADPVSIARLAYEAYVRKDRSTIERVIAADFRFTSPLDNAIDRQTYFERCWPNSEWIEGFDFINLVRDGQRVFVTYEGHGARGYTFRNTEIVTVRDGQIVDVEVYFGWPIPHKAAPGSFLSENASKAEWSPVAKTGMLIRKSPEEVFAAFINPDITTKFWFTGSSGPLEVGKTVRWEWEMYDGSTQVTPKTIEPHRRIVIEWDGFRGPTTVEWKFARQQNDATFVSVTESGFTGTGEELLKKVTEATQGFTWVLASLKGFLEHGLQLNFVADRFPKGPKDPYPDE
jgi:uncharacterized protein YndB with AHSA1/START domain